MQNNINRANALRTPAQRESLVIFVVKRIEDALINNEIKPGDFLPPEAELSKNLNVGKSSVREALKMLQAMGVVEVRQGQGTQIRKRLGKSSINPLIFQLIAENDQPKDIVELRMMFEPAYTLLAMEKATEEDIEFIRGTHERFETVIDKGIQTVEDDVAFHLSILQATHNHYVIRIGQTILQLFKPAMMESLKSNPQIALRDHRNILQAFCDRDERQVREAITKSFENWKTGLFAGGSNDQTK